MASDDRDISATCVRRCVVDTVSDGKMISDRREWNDNAPSLLLSLGAQLGLSCQCAVVGTKCVRWDSDTRSNAS